MGYCREIHNRHRAPTTQNSSQNVLLHRDVGATPHQYQRRTLYTINREPAFIGDGRSSEQQSSNMKTDLKEDSPNNGAQKPDTTSPSKKRSLSRQCTVPGCPTRGAVDETGTCSAHGAKRKRCKIEGCPNGKWLTNLLCSETYICCAHDVHTLLISTGTNFDRIIIFSLLILSHCLLITHIFRCRPRWSLRQAWSKAPHLQICGM